MDFFFDILQALLIIGLVIYAWRHECLKVYAAYIAHWYVSSYVKSEDTDIAPLEWIKFHSEITSTRVRQGFHQKNVFFKEIHPSSQDTSLRIVFEVDDALHYVLLPRDASYKDVVKGIDIFLNKIISA